MRLLNTTSLALHEFFGDSIPSYVILSHRWEDAEVTFQDLQTGGRPISKEGWSKIKGCCTQAVRDGWEYAWIDSCCIDKTSSSELSEAINSMYQWYEKSQVCYVYLSDVVSVPTGWKVDRHDSSNSEFRRSKWFTRGLTLQELVAPRTVVFYDSSWREIGTRNSLGEVVSDITSIAPEHLYDPREASVAQRMSWASKRKTTRVEDQAYSLLGLFNVNMPLLYGEGLKSFWRLQLKIMAISDDESILAWNPTWRLMARMGPQGEGLIAQHPADFTDSGNVVKKKGINTRPPYHMTNRGLHIESYLLPEPSNFGQKNRYIFPIHCTRGVDGCLGVTIYNANRGMEWSKIKFNDWCPMRKGILVVIKEPERPPQRTVMYVKQPSTPTLVDLRFINNASFALSIESLLHYNFSIFRESCHNCSHGPFTAQNVSAYSINSIKQQRIREHDTWDLGGCRPIFLQFVSKAYVEKGLMKVDSENPDSFVVVLNRRQPEQVFDIIIPEESQSKGMIKETYFNLPERSKDGVDRISKLMRSGSSVSAALKKRPISEGRNFYLLDITIDPKGWLPWPA